VADDVACLVTLDLEDPLEPDGAVPSGEYGELLGAVILDGLHFLAHCLTPSGLALSLLEGCRLIC
jgi:hypothetical protein